MSEKIFAWLLRLYPSRFRETYGDEILQLFRDRASEEKGLVPRLRLWLNLLADFAISIPREYFYAEPELLAASDQNMSGAPSFYVLGDESPRAGALLSGAMLSVAALAAFSFLLGQGGNRGASRPRAHQSSNGLGSLASGRPASRPTHNQDRNQDRNESSSNAAANSPSASAQEQFATATSNQPAMDATPFRPDQPNPSASRPTSSFASPAWQPAQPSSSPSRALADASSTNTPASANNAPSWESGNDAAPSDQEGQLDAAERHRVVGAAAANLKQHYFDSHVAQEMSDALLAHETRGDDNAPSAGVFADLLTRQMREVSHDPHLVLVYSRDPLPQHAVGPSPEHLADYRNELQSTNCTFEKVEILPRNVGYLKLDSFPDPAVCQSTASAAMRRLNHANAIIFDLRDNRGGMPDMVAFMAAYLFDHPEYLYNPRENTTEHSWTHSPIPGNLLADKPVYILTSSSTYSGAEQFCYDLKMLKRATLVGETTGGGAHSGVFHRIDDHFGMGIPEVKPINPFSTPDWAEAGVEPDIKVSAADALKTAVKLATSKLPKP